MPTKLKNEKIFFYLKIKIGNNYLIFREIIPNPKMFYPIAFFSFSPQKNYHRQTFQKKITETHWIYFVTNFLFLSYFSKTFMTKTIYDNKIYLFDYQFFWNVKQKWKWYFAFFKKNSNHQRVSLFSFSKTNKLKIELRKQFHV